MGRYIEFQIPLIGVTVNSLVVENTSTNNYFVVANASMTDENIYGVVQFPPGTPQWGIAGQVSIGMLSG